MYTIVYSLLQMVWSKACEVGCAIAECSGLHEHYNRFYGHYYNHNDYYEGPLYLLVGIYGASYPEDDGDMICSTSIIPMRLDNLAATVLIGILSVTQIPSLALMITQSRLHKMVQILCLVDFAILGNVGNPFNDSIQNLHFSIIDVLFGLYSCRQLTRNVCWV